MNEVKRGVISACPNWLDMAPLYIISLCATPVQNVVDHLGIAGNLQKLIFYLSNVSENLQKAQFSTKIFFTLFMSLCLYVGCQLVELIVPEVN